MVWDKKSAGDMKAVMDQFTTLMQGMKIPGVDMEQVLAAQRRNMEACTKAAQVAAEAAGAVARRQTELMQMAMAEATSLFQGFKPGGRPEEMMARQAEFAKKAFETSLVNAKELAEMVGKSTEEAFQIVQRRVTEGLDEIHQAAEKQVKKR